MDKSKVGPWLKKDFDSFLVLPIEMRTMNSLADWHFKWTHGSDRLSPSGRQFIDEGWKTRRAHPVFIWLEKEQTFNRIWKLFKHKQKKATSDDKLRHPKSDFELLNVIVDCAGWAFWGAELSSGQPGKQRGQKCGLTSGNRKQAIAYATRLLDLDRREVCLSDVVKRGELRTLLGELRLELKQTKRKPRMGARAVELTPIMVFARRLVRAVGFPSSAAVMAFAELVNVKCDARTAQRYVTDAARE